MRKLLLQLFAFSAIILLVFLLFNFEENFTGTLNMLMDNKLKYALFSFILMVSDILLPIPSSIVLFSNGLVLGMLGGFLLSMLSVMAASIIGYGLGRFFSSKFNSMISTQAAAHLYRKYGFLSIFLTRGIPILSESVTLICGYNKIEFRSFLLLNLIGYVPVCFIYAYFGEYGSHADHFLLSFALSIVLSLLFWFFGKLLSKKGNKFNWV